MLSQIIGKVKKIHPLPGVTEEGGGGGGGREREREGNER